MIEAAALQGVVEVARGRGVRAFVGEVMFNGDARLGTVLNAGSHTLAVTFTPPDTANYETASASRTVHVVDTTAPVIGSPGASATIECPETPAFVAPTAVDACEIANTRPDVTYANTLPETHRCG